MNLFGGLSDFRKWREFGFTGFGLRPGAEFSELEGSALSGLLSRRSDGRNLGIWKFLELNFETELIFETGGFSDFPEMAKNSDLRVSG